MSSSLCLSPSFQLKRFVLLLVVMGMNFSVTLMEIAFLICGAVMGKKTVKMVVMKKAAVVPYDCVITKPSFPVGVQVSRTLGSTSTSGLLPWCRFLWGPPQSISHLHKKYPCVSSRFAHILYMTVIVGNIYWELSVDLAQF